MKIKVEIRERQSEKDPKLRGFADVTLGDVVIKDVAVKEFEGKNEGKTYYGFQMPNSRSYEKEDGTRAYIPAVEIKTTKEEDTKKLDKVKEKTMSLKDEIDKSFYTKSLDLSEEDFISDDEEEEIKPSKSIGFLKFLFSLILILAVGFGVYYVITNF